MRPQANLVYAGPAGVRRGVQILAMGLVAALVSLQAWQGMLEVSRGPQLRDARRLALNERQLQQEEQTAVKSAAKASVVLTTPMPKLEDIVMTDSDEEGDCT